MKAELIRLRQRAIRCEDESAYYRSVGNELLAQRICDEQKRLEIECGHIEMALHEGIGR